MEAKANLIQLLEECLDTGNSGEYPMDIVDRLSSHLFNKHKTWRERFSTEFLNEQIFALLDKVEEEGNRSKITVYLDNLISNLDGYMIEQYVFMPLFGLTIEHDLPPLPLGDVTITLMTPERVIELTMLLRPTINSQTDPKHKEVITGWIDALVGSTYAEYKIIADSTKARERAEEATRLALDLLRYAFPFTHSFGGSVRIGFQGLGTRTIPVIQSDGQAFSLRQEGMRQPLPFYLSSKAVGKMREVGVFDLSEIITKPQEDRTEFENRLLHGIHWFANAQSELEIEYKFLSLMICLETFLSEQNQDRVTNAIAEGVAIILNTELEPRLRIRDNMRTLYGKRSAISHGRGKASKKGKPSDESITAEDVEQLTGYVAYVLVWLIQEKDKFKTKDDLLEWLDTERLSPKPAP